VFSEKDIVLFTELLKRYLLDYYKNILFRDKVKNYSERIRLFCFCILDNHFHLLLQQLDKNAMNEFLQSLQVSFTAFINRRNGRSGHLFESVYKARMMENEVDLAATSKYIHLNPDPKDAKGCLNYPYSSIYNYVPGSYNSWEFVDNSRILRLFNNSKKDYLTYISTRA